MATEDGRWSRSLF